MHSQSQDLGSQVTPRVGMVPLAVAAGARTGTGIDTEGAACAIVTSVTGVVTGAPSALTVTVKVQDSPDNATDWQDIPGASFVASAASGVKSFNVSLAATRRYIRVIETTAFTGGTTPNLNTGVLIQLGGKNTLPAT